jgi:hypothetical protein
MFMAKWRGGRAAVPAAGRGTGASVRRRGSCAGVSISGRGHGRADALPRGMGCVAPAYRPRASEHTVLHQVVAQHLESFLRAVGEAGDGTGLPQFEFLLCGMFEAGVARWLRARASGAVLVQRPRLVSELRVVAYGCGAPDSTAVAPARIAGSKATSERTTAASGSRAWTQTWTTLGTAGGVQAVTPEIKLSRACSHKRV